jgi:hypothetical protein
MTIKFKKIKQHSITEITKVLSVFEDMDYMTTEIFSDCVFEDWDGTELADLNNKIDGLKTMLELKLAELESEKLNSWKESNK